MKQKKLVRKCSENLDRLAATERVFLELATAMLLYQLMEITGKLLELSKYFHKAQSPI